MLQLNNIQRLLEQVARGTATQQLLPLFQAITEGVYGDYFEVGVGRGGTAMLAKSVFMANALYNRRVIMADRSSG